MKRLLLTLILLSLAVLAYSQDIPKLKLTREGIEPIIVEVDSGLTAEEMYKRALNWIKESYENPGEVVKAKFENEKIRLNGFAKDAWFYKSFGKSLYYDMKYSLEIAFKDGKYKFSYEISDNFYTDGSRAYHFTQMFTGNGQVKKYYAEDGVPSLEKTMNDLSTSFYNFVTGQTKVVEDDW